MRRFALLLTIALLLSAGIFALSHAQGVKKNKEAEAPKAKVLGKSWSDQATAAYNAKNYSEAIFLYRKWLEADPRDASSWYNLACTYSLARNANEALGALENAVLAGYENVQHMQVDTDLEFVRKKVRFRALVEQLNAKSKEAGVNWNHVKFESTGLYATYFPEGYDPKAEKQETRYKLVLTLHGAGSTAEGHGGAFRKIMGEEDCIYICPRAPFGIPVGGGELGYVAWIPESRGQAWSTKQSLGQWCAMAKSCVDDAMKRYPVDGEKVYVAGHSMGGGASLAFTASYPELVASVFCYAGYHVDAINTAEQLGKVKAAGVKVNICHCRGDQAVKFEEGEKAAKAWTDAGCEVTTIYFEDASHSFIKPVQEAMKAWADKTLRGK